MEKKAEVNQRVTLGMIISLWKGIHDSIRAKVETTFPMEKDRIILTMTLILKDV